jgi:starvation-inducible outer membrane lipoprotein
MRTIIIATLLLAGCAAQPPRVTGTEHAVSVNWANASLPDALPAAEAHCAKFGRHAQFSGKVAAFEAAFNCVKS